MLTVKEAIEKRRSIRKFTAQHVSPEYLNQILEAARLAPSATNRQPWRFKVITDPKLKMKIYEEATFDQKQVLQAPVIIVCGSELFTFVKRHPKAPQESDYYGAESDNWDDIKAFIPDAQMNTAIAIEHMVLMATALGIGSSWVQRIRFGKLAAILGLPRHIVVHAILAIGYPEEIPPDTARYPLEEIIIGNDQGNP